MHRRRRGGNWRKAMFRLHGWLGLNFGLLLFVICFSGSFATLSNEIDWLLDARQRVPARDAPYDWTAMHESLVRAFPEGANKRIYVAGASGLRPGGAGVAAVAYVDLPTGQTRKVYLDPYSGALRGHTSFFNTQRFFRSFHRRFFDGERGIVIVTLCAFVLLTIALSGFSFYKGWLKQLLTLRLSRSRRLRWSDLHKTAGIWGFAFALLIALTGVFYFVEVLFQAAGNYDALLPPPLPEVEEAGLTAFGPQPELLPLEVYVAEAEAANPELLVRSVRIPDEPGEAVYVDGQAGNSLTRDRADNVLLHPFTAEVLGVQKTGDLGIVPFITDAVDPLHFGYVGGLWTKVLWCGFGLLLSFSILSGSYLWVVRSGTGRRTESWWLRGVPVAVAVTLAYFAVVVFATMRGIQAYAPVGPAAVPAARFVVGPYQVRMDCRAPCDLEQRVTLAARFLGQGLPNYAKAELLAANGDVQVLSGPSRRPAAIVQTGRGVPLTLRVTMRDGRIHEASFTPSLIARPEPRGLAGNPRHAHAFQASLMTRQHGGGRSWPDTAAGVWWVVGSFIVLTTGFILGWLALVVRALRRAAAGRTISGART